MLLILTPGETDLLCVSFQTEKRKQDDYNSSLHPKISRLIFVPVLLPDPLEKESQVPNFGKQCQ